jgi:hypothetical protein
MEIISAAHGQAGTSPYVPLFYALCVKNAPNINITKDRPERVVHVT